MPYEKEKRQLLIEWLWEIESIPDEYAREGLDIDWEEICRVMQDKLQEVIRTYTKGVSHD